jgi:hypothetical protein
MRTYCYGNGGNGVNGGNLGNGKSLGIFNNLSWPLGKEAGLTVLLGGKKSLGQGGRGGIPDVIGEHCSF